MVVRQARLAGDVTEHTIRLTDVPSGKSVQIKISAEPGALDMLNEVLYDTIGPDNFWATCPTIEMTVDGEVTHEATDRTEF